MLQAKRESRACWGGASQSIVLLETTSGNRISYRTCPGNLYSEGWQHWVELYRHYKRGLLPFPGSVVEQPSKVFEVFEVIEQYETGLELKKQQKPKGRRGR